MIVSIAVRSRDDGYAGAVTTFRFEALLTFV